MLPKPYHDDGMVTYPRWQNIELGNRKNIVFINFSLKEKQLAIDAYHKAKQWWPQAQLSKKLISNKQLERQQWTLFIHFVRVHHREKMEQLQRGKGR